MFNSRKQSKDNTNLFSAKMHSTLLGNQVHTLDGLLGYWLTNNNNLFFPVLPYDIKLGHQTRDVLSSKRKYNSINNSNDNQKEDSKYNISWNSFCILRMINSWNNQKGTQYIFSRNALLYLLVTRSSLLQGYWLHYNNYLLIQKPIKAMSLITK